MFFAPSVSLVTLPAKLKAMLTRRHTPTAPKSVKHYFLLAEANQFVGGFAGWMNGRIAGMEHCLDEAGGKRPYGILFGGGDGKVNSVWIEVFEAKP